MCSRRNLIKGIACSQLVLLGGCSEIGAGSNQSTELMLRNYTPAPQTVTVRVVSRGAEDRSNGTLFRQEIQLAADDAEDNTRTITEAFPSEPAVVSIRLSSVARGSIVSQYYFTPDCQPQNESSDAVFVDITGEDADGEAIRICFDQTSCASL
jgi:hypothetical protein